MSAVRLKVVQLGHKGLRTVITELVKQVVQVPKKLENRTKNRTKGKKNKSLVQGVKGIPKISIGFRQECSEFINAAESSRACVLFHKQA